MPMCNNETLSYIFDEATIFYIYVLSMLTTMNRESSVRKRKYETGQTVHSLIDKSAKELRLMVSNSSFSQGCRDGVLGEVLGAVLGEVLTIVYDRLCSDIEWMIGSRSVSMNPSSSEARYATVRAIQAMSLLNRDMRVRTTMTPRVAACVFYQLRCQRPMSKNVPPYENVPYALNLSTPLQSTSAVYWDKTGHSKKDKVVAKIARAPPPNPQVYYEMRRLGPHMADGSTRETEGRLSKIPSKCENFTWNDALETVFLHERLSELESAPVEVHAYVTSSRARFQRDMQRTSKSKRTCVNRVCRREYPCYESKNSRNEFHEQILFYLFPKIDRHYSRYWLELLRSYMKTSIGAVSFCSSICFEQCWMPCMRATLGSTEWMLHVDDVKSLEEQKDQKSQRVHAVLKCLVDRNRGMHVDLKRLIERDQRSSTCLRERDVKAIVEMMIYVINMDTVIVMLMSTLRASDSISKDPCPLGWRAKLSDEEMRQYANSAMCLVNLRQSWQKNADTTLIHTTYDLAHLQRHCRQHIRTNLSAFVVLR